MSPDITFSCCEFNQMQKSAFCNVFILKCLLFQLNLITQLPLSVGSTKDQIEEILEEDRWPLANKQTIFFVKPLRCFLQSYSSRFSGKCYFRVSSHSLPIKAARSDRPPSGKLGTIRFLQQSRGMEISI